MVHSHFTFSCVSLPPSPNLAEKRLLASMGGFQEKIKGERIVRRREERAMRWKENKDVWGKQRSWWSLDPRWCSLLRRSCMSLFPQAAQKASQMAGKTRRDFWKTIGKKDNTIFSIKLCCLNANLYVYYSSIDFPPLFKIISSLFFKYSLWNMNVY